MRRDLQTRVAPYQVPMGPTKTVEKKRKEKKEEGGKKTKKTEQNKQEHC